MRLVFPTLYHFICITLFIIHIFKSIMNMSRMELVGIWLSVRHNLRINRTVECSVLDREQRPIDTDLLTPNRPTKSSSASASSSDEPWLNSYVWMKLWAPLGDLKSPNQGKEMATTRWSRSLSSLKFTMCVELTWEFHPPSRNFGHSQNRSMRKNVIMTFCSIIPFMYIQ